MATFVAFVLGGCTSSQFVQTNVQSASQPGVEIYISNELPQRAYDVIGHIETSGWVFTSHETLLDGLRERAKKASADAVIKTEFKYFSHGFSSLPYVEGIAVKWK
ncbi:MAG TPA: hypothetical protein VEC36_04280 [Patescibacteria group bacterium]|nr:hypothetical protein [Patescibacteria group bacterium]